LPLLDVVEAYETELGVASGTLLALHEQARLEVYGEDPSHLRAYALKPVWDPPHQLPSDVADFTGRESELERLRAVLAERSGGTVVISAIAGTVGVGKTALAVHLARELGADFPDVSPPTFSRPSTISSTECSRTGSHGAGPTSMTGSRFLDPRARMNTGRHGTTRVSRAF
jgi:hypothetical protein